MGVGELIEHIRALYVADLQRAFESSGEVHPEPVVSDGSRGVVREGALRLPSRCDGIAITDGVAASFAVNSEGVLGFEPIEFAWGEDLHVSLTPFCWDFAEFEVPTAGTRNLAENLTDWFERWFSRAANAEAPANSEPGVEGGLVGALHSLSGVHRNGEGSCFQVDFGSAPLACFEDLLDVLSASQARSVTVREAI